MTLSTTEPNNDVGLIKVRQADDETQIFDAQITENGAIKSFSGLTPFFCLMAREVTGQGVSEEPVKTYDGVKGTLKYTVSANAMQMVGRNEAYFSFRKELKTGEWVEQFSTRSFYYTVEKSIYTEPFRDSNYWFTFKELYRLFNQYIIDGKTSWEEFLEQNREILESIDPGGVILSELIRSRKPEGAENAYPDLPARLDGQIGKNDEFRAFEISESFLKRIANEFEERASNLAWYDLPSTRFDVTEKLNRAINDVSLNGGGTLYIPKGKYELTGNIILQSNVHVQCHPDAVFYCLKDNFASDNYAVLINGEFGRTYEKYGANHDFSWDGGTFIMNETLDQNNTMSCFGIADGVNIIFKNMTIKNVIYSHAFDIVASKNVLLENVSCIGHASDRYYSDAFQFGNGFAGGFGLFGSFTGAPCESITVRGCTVVPNPEDENFGGWGVGIGNHALLAESKYMKDFTFENNYFEECRYAGIRSFGYRKVICRGNRYQDCEIGLLIDGYTGYIVEGQAGTEILATENLVADNEFFDSCRTDVQAKKSIDGIKHKTITISNCISRDCSGWSLNLAATDGLIINGCQIDNPKQSVHIDGVENLVIGACQFFGATEEHINATGADKNQNWTIVNNIFKISGRAGILLETALNGIKVSNNILVDVCQIEDNIRDAIGLFGSGIQNGAIADNLGTFVAENRPRNFVMVSDACININVFGNIGAGRTGGTKVFGNNQAGVLIPNGSGNQYLVYIDGSDVLKSKKI